MTASPNAGSGTGSDVWSGLASLAQSGVQAFTVYETAETAKTASKKLSSSNLTYVILGLGGLAIVALLVLKH